MDNCITPQYNHFKPNVTQGLLCFEDNVNGKRKHYTGHLQAPVHKSGTLYRFHCEL